MVTDILSNAKCSCVLIDKQSNCTYGFIINCCGSNITPWLMMELLSRLMKHSLKTLLKLN